MAAVGVFYIAVFLSVLAFVAYLLLGPGFTINLPAILGLGTGTSTNNTSVVDLLREQKGTLFVCADSKALKAEFSGQGVNLALSDGRRLSLPRSLSAAGARYSNPDESFIFYTIEAAAFVEESGATTYRDCTASATN